MFKGNIKDNRLLFMTSFWCLYCGLWTYFLHFSSVFIVQFKEVNVLWFDRALHGKSNIYNLTYLLKAINQFFIKNSSKMFDRVLNTPLAI